MTKFKKQLAIFNPIYWPAWLGLGTLWTITRLPSRWQINFAKMIGRLIYRFPTKMKHVAETNVRLCFPEMSEAERAALVKKNFESIGVGLIEAARAWWLPDNKLKHSYQLKGLEYAEAAFAKGKGIILVGPHFTSLEMVGRLLGMTYDFAVMYRPHKKQIVSFVQERFRKKHYMHYIPRHRIRLLLRTLEKNMAVWYAYDIDGGEKRSVFAPFFNIPTASLTSVSRIARLSNAAVIPIHFYRHDNDFKYEIILSPPCENFPSENLEQDATRLNKILENAIREKPEQYIWQYKRFKTRPVGEKRFY